MAYPMGSMAGQSYLDMAGNVSAAELQKRAEVDRQMLPGTQGQVAAPPRETLSSTIERELAEIGYGNEDLIGRLMKVRERLMGPGPSEKRANEVPAPELPGAIPRVAVGLSKIRHHQHELVALVEFFETLA